MNLLRSLKINKKGGYLFWYTAGFLFLAPLVFFWFLKDQRSFIWINDGADQHYMALLYYGRLLREWIGGIFSGEGFAVPLYDFSLGQGDDILTTLHYYCIGDPLALTAAFCPEQYTEVLYNVLVLLRFYLMGLSFSAFCFYQKKDGKMTLVGAFSYVFCGFALAGAIKHPFFLNPMIYFPLLCLSVEKVLHKESRKLFIAMTALCAASNFYFFYMLSVLTVLYALVRFFDLYPKGERAENFAEIVPKGIASYLLGVSISAVVFIPVVARFLDNPRYVEGADKLFLTYSLNYYGRMIASFTGKAWTSGYWTFFGFAPVVLAALCLLFTKRGKGLFSLRVFTVLGTLFLLFPVFGYVLNGCDYVSNRWMFAFHFLMAYLVTEMLPELLAGMKKGALLCMTAAVAAVVFMDIYASLNGNRVDITGLCLLLLFFAFCVYMGRKQKKTGYYAGVLALTLFSIVVNANGMFREKKSQFVPAGEYNAYVNSQPAAELAMQEEETFYRVDSYVGKSWDRGYAKENPTREELLASFGALPLEEESADFGDGEADDLETADTAADDTAAEGVQKKKVKKLHNFNLGMLHGYYGLSEYFSMLNPYYPVYINRLAVSASNYSSQIASLDQRTALNALAGVKYYLSSSFDYYPAPYGYEELARYEAPDGKTMTLYENLYALPIAFTYDTWLSEEKTAACNELELQQLMLQTAVLSDVESKEQLPEELATLPEGTVLVRKATFAEENPETVIGKKTSLRFLDAGTWATFTMKGKKRCEVYVYLENVTFSGAKSVSVSVCADGVHKRTSLYAPEKKEYFGRQNILLNLGYYEDGLTSFSLHVNKKGTLHYDSIKVLLVPMEDYAEQIEERKEEVLENLVIGTNRLDGTVQTDGEKLLFFSVPYSEGFHATVNGKRVPVYRANTLYFAVPVEAGENTVTITYRTPGLVFGACLSLLSIACCIAYLLWERRRKEA